MLLLGLLERGLVHGNGVDREIWLQQRLLLLDDGLVRLSSGLATEGEKIVNINELTFFTLPLEYSS